jgi:hypothetical protein
MLEFDNDIKKTARAVGVKADYLKKILTQEPMPG